MSWIRAFADLNKSLLLKGLLLLMAFLLGLQMGQARLQRQWDAEKKTVQIVQAKQEQHVADVRLSQSQITQEISREFSKRSKLLADRQRDNRDGWVCDIPAAGGRHMPTFSEASARAAQARSDSLPAPQRDAGEVSCEQLSEDAAQTTLMLLEVQRWYQKQSTVDP
jgi:hypothetical protein